MENAIQTIDNSFSITGQISEQDLTEIAEAGFKSIICCRPDGEGGEAQPTHLQLQKEASKLGLKLVYVPVIPNQINTNDVEKMAHLLETLPNPTLGYCRTGNRAKQLYQMAKSMAPSTKHETETSACNWTSAFDVVVVGGGAAGIGVTASLLKRRKDLRIAIIEPNEWHYYQPAWTLVGGGAFDILQSQRRMQEVIPKSADWIQGRVSHVDATGKKVTLEDGRDVEYHQLILCPGLVLDWGAIEGLSETLGQHGVTSNYRVDLAPYTWETVKNLRFGKAIFTQPPMPIKCAGAPQKAMYMSCSHWKKVGHLNNIEVEFNNAGAVLFGVAHFVPALMKYVEAYGAKLVFNSTLVKVDGPNHKAWFDIKDNDGNISRREKSFDMLHVVPPQKSPSFIKESDLADAAGWCDVDQTTLQHKRYPTVFGLGDVINAPNAKTAAAARKQIVVVAENLIAAKEMRTFPMQYDGYGACPLTVEHGRVVLAEFGYGGKLLPTFPLSPEVPRRLAWWLKTSVMPWVYWNLMLKGREWLASPSRANKK